MLFLEALSFLPEKCLELEVVLQYLQSHSQWYCAYEIKLKSQLDATIKEQIRYLGKLAGC